MNTKIIKIDTRNIDMDKITFAANVLKQGGLVAFPTETVYGLGANALSESAVRNIYAAKGRPSDNPLIVHIANMNALESLVLKIPDNARDLMDKFWPGPLTIIMEKSKEIPSIITAGLTTVAIRMPLHPVALSLIDKSGLPIAAPSANTSGKPSPTNAKHVIQDLYGKVDIIIDAGDCNVGLESTVLDVTVCPPRILRPGGITPKELEEVVHKISFASSLLTDETNSSIPKAPGMKYTHYSPNADVFIVEGAALKVSIKINQLIEEYLDKGLIVGVMATEQSKNAYKGTATVISMGDKDKPETIAANLFKCLRDFDEKKVDVILAESIDSTGIGLAVMNRLKKAAGYKIICAS